MDDWRTSLLWGSFHAQPRCLVVLRQIARGNRDVVAVAYLRVMRRHDFDPAFIEGVLNVAMQLRVNLIYLVGPVGIRVDFVGYKKVVERRLPNKRLRLLQNEICLASRASQQLMNGLPWSAIANRYCCVQDESLLFRSRTEVLDVGTQRLEAWHDNLFVFDRALPHIQEPAFEYFSEGLSNAY